MCFEEVDIDHIFETCFAFLLFFLYSTPRNRVHEHKTECELYEVEINMNTIVDTERGEGILFLLKSNPFLTQIK